jgi:SEC-C motif domain protein
MCHCGLPESYDDCCGRYHRGEATAPTAEALMRSRYSAFVEGEIDYLETSLLPGERDDFDHDSSAQWAKKSTWLGLDIINVEQGGEGDTEGVVEYVANFKAGKQTMKHHEIGYFAKSEGVWYYSNGEMVAPETFRREGVKVGRNDPCPCGSGKKYKKCCG